MSTEQRNETEAVSENPPKTPQAPQPRKRHRKTKWFLIFLVIGAAVGGYAYYKFVYFSSTEMLARAQCELNVGNTREAEAILKDCIRRTDIADAKVKLVELCWKTGDFQQMLLLDKTMIRTNRNRPLWMELDTHSRKIIERRQGRIERAFAEGYKALASKEFSEKKWNDSSLHYFIAYYRYNRSTSDGTVPSSGMECLRNGIAASVNAGDKAMVKSYGDKFLEHYCKHPGWGEDKDVVRYMQDVQKWMREMETRR